MRYGNQYENEYDTETTGSGFGIAGFIAGVAAGAALGMLFAPKSGRETRQDIADMSGQAKEKLDEWIESGRTEWSRLKGKATDMASMTHDEVNDFIHYLMNEGRDLRSRVRNDVRSGAERAGARTSQMADDMRRGV